MSIADALAYFGGVKLPEREQVIAQELLKEIQGRLQFLMNVGLHYLTLGRSAPSLSGGEAQRIRLASQIGCGLVGVLYILDEPSIGLHQRITALMRRFSGCVDLGSTVWWWSTTKTIRASTGGHPDRRGSTAGDRRRRRKRPGMNRSPGSFSREKQH
jgi:excinuclease UvrABC ATPase subunit